MIPEMVAAVLGPLIGSYFGLKGALNGLKESARRAEASIGDIRDTQRKALFELEEHRKETTRYVDDLKADIRQHI